MDASIPEISQRQRSYTLFVLVMVFTASHIDRQIVAILQEPIKHAFQLSDTQLGLLTGVTFALFYATLGMPMAMWADRHNRRNLIAFSISLWSGMTVACGMVLQFWQLLLARIGVAVGEAGSNPPSHSIISDLYPARERATAMAIFSLGVNFGIMFGFLIGGWVNDWLGWRWAFIIAGIPGLIIALVVRFTMIEPARGYSDKIAAGSNAPAAAVAAATPAPPPFWLVAKTMIKNARIRQLVVANTLISMAGYAMVAWVPVYFQRVHGFSTSESGTMLALLIGLGGGMGTFSGGYFADRLAKISEGWRAWVVCVAAAITLPMSYLCYTATDPFWAVVWFVIPATLGGAYIGTNFAILQSLAPIEMRAVMAAINLFMLNIVGLGLGPLSVGMINDWAALNFSNDSIRYGLLFTLIILIWGVAHESWLGVLLHRHKTAPA